MKKLIISIVFISVAAVIFTLSYQQFSSHGKKRLIVEKSGTLIDNLKCKDCNLIMISLSNVSAGHMSLYGYKRITTPNLDKWARDAIIFNNAFTQSSWTLPVATSLFTSLYPYTHKITNRFNENVLDADIKTLPEILRDNGYKTAAFTGGLDYSYVFGHMRGFEFVDEARDGSSAIEFAGFSYTLKKASDWLSQNSGSRFFLFLHGYDCHCPFNPPEKFRGRFSHAEGKNITVDNKECLRGYENSKNGNYEAYYYRGGHKKVVLTKDDIDYLEDLYDEEILSVDELIGDFLKNLDKRILDKTIIVIFSDHGEMFARHGRFGRAGAVRGTLYDDVLHIPLIIKIPQYKGKETDGMVQIIDIMPTLLNVMNIPIPKKIQGRDMAVLIEEDKPINEYVFAGSKFGWVQGPSLGIYTNRSTNESVRNMDWKLIHEISHTKDGKFIEDSYELYNFKEDPEEIENIIKKEPFVAEELKAVLEKWKTASYDFKTESHPQLLSPEIVEEAKKRGYW